jgi:hypothetical protein
MIIFTIWCIVGLIINIATMWLSFREITIGNLTISIVFAPLFPFVALACLAENDTKLF